MILDEIFSYADTGLFMRTMSFFYSYRTKVMITVSIILILILCVVLGSLWVLFQKADKKGYLAIIPFYNIIEVLKMTGLPGYHFFLLLIPIINLYSLFIVSKEIARVFKQKPSYGVLIFFFPYIFLLKLALGNSQYDKNYYYKSVNDSSNNEYVIVKNDIDDYNQGLVFDPSTNVDDVVKSAPYDPTLSNFFRDKNESENEFMAFLDMSDDARKNEEANMNGEYNAVPNNMNMGTNMNMNAAPANDIMNEVPLSNNNMSTEPNKMSVEALIGRPTTEDINTPKVVAPQQPQVDLNNIFNVGLNNGQPVMQAPVPEAPSPAPQMEMNAPVIPEPQLEIINPVMEAPEAQQMDAPVEEEGISPEAAKNINDDINKILGIDVNNRESVPVQNSAPSIPTIGGDIVPPTNPVEVHQATNLINGGNNLVQNAVDFASKETPQDVGAPTICPNCGTTLPNGAKFCYMCGKAL